MSNPRPTRDVHHMVHYIRLLRTPQVTLTQKSVIEVSAVVSITTDLGDAFLLHPLEVVSRVVSVNESDNIIAEGVSSWKSGARVLKLAIRCPKPAQNAKCVLHVTTKEHLANIASNVVPSVLDVWSAEFYLRDGVRAEALVNRQLYISPSSCVKSWEETGESIARHIWDAALACLICFQHMLFSSKTTPTQLPSFQALLKQKVKGGLHVLELGAGCGVVGIALAQVLPKCNVLLTDLEDAQGMLEQNVRCARLGFASTLRRAVLDWTVPLDNSILPTRIDLVLLADCIYNTNSIPSLVQTLTQIHVHSPDCKLFIARKPRHESETMFFTLIEKTGLQLLESSTIDLPHLETEVDTIPPPVEFHLYG